MLDGGSDAVVSVVDDGLLDSSDDDPVSVVGSENEDDVLIQVLDESVDVS